MAGRIPIVHVSTGPRLSGDVVMVTLDVPWPRTERVDRAARLRARRELPGFKVASRIVQVSPILRDGRVRMVVAVSRQEG